MRLSLLFFALSLVLNACGPSPMERIQSLQARSRGQTLWPDAHVQSRQLNELSGLARASEGAWLWAHNDSGDQARIFAVSRDGASIGGSDGILIPEAAHIDWEDIASDGEGRLFIGDFGNNKSVRDRLQVYVVQEPGPEAETARVQSVLHFHLPQEERSEAKQNDDIEALFYKDSFLYLLTKHRSDRHTRLFRLDLKKAGQVQSAVKIGEFAIGGQVTGADYFAQSQCLAVLTYDRVFVFDARSVDGELFQRKLAEIPYRARQCEAIVFLDADTLLIGNEQRELFVMPVIP